MASVRKNLVTELLKERERTISEASLLEEVKAILDRDEHAREAIRQRLEQEIQADTNNFKFDNLETRRIFHRRHIRKICIDYRLRFLDSHLFKGEIPEEAISKIKTLEKEHDTLLSGFMIAAPSRLFHLKNYDDPLLFVPVGNDYYYLVHKWGNDMNPFRKIVVRPMRDFGSLLVFLAVSSLLFASLITQTLFNGEKTGQFMLIAFLFTFKSFCGIALYYCFWQGKNFNSAIWDSEYYNR